MKTKQYIITLCLTLLILLISCNDFLDVQPKGKTIPETTTDYGKLLVKSTMVKTVDEIAMLMTDDIYMYYIDDTFMTFGYYYGLGQEKNLYTFKDEIYENNSLDPFWTYAYRRINTYNIVADNVLNSSGGTKDEKNVLLGEALTGRAFEYLLLINTYAKTYNVSTAVSDLGVPLILSTNLNLGENSRASVQEVYNQIEKDLKEATDLLKERPDKSIYRASKPAAHGLLARMYLYMDNYAEALKHSEECLKYNSELLDFNKYNVINQGSWSKRIDLPHGLDNIENIYLRMPALEYGKSASMYVSDDLIAMFDRENDKRWELFYTDNYTNFHTERYFWAPIIYVNIGVATPEIYLIAAESAVRIGNLAKGVDYLNRLRSNRYSNYQPIAPGVNALLREIFNERRRELAFYGLNRLFDLKRINKEEQFSKKIIHKLEGEGENGDEVDETFILEPNANKYALPIPTSVLQYNPNMEQNPR